MHASREFLDSSAWRRLASAPPARILLFVADLSATGVVRNAIAIANRLADEGFMVNLVTCRAGGALAAEVNRRVELTQLLSEKAAALPRALKLAASLRAYRRHLRGHRPDLMLSAGNHGHMLCRAAWGAARGAKRVYRISNDLDHQMAGKPQSRLGRLVRHVQLRLIASGADRLVLVSPHLRRQVRSELPAEVIPNGVDAAAVRRRSAAPCPHPWLKPGAPPALVAVGRLATQKNFPTLLRALAIARSSKPLRLVILGGGSQRARDTLMAEAAELGICDAVDFAPPTANPFPYMARASALVLPSWWEGASNVLLEAMACGTPVLASRTAGNAQEVLGYGRFGLLVDPDDAAGMAEAMLAQAGADPCRPGRRAEAFGRDAALSAYVGLVTRLLGGKPMRASKPLPVSPNVSVAPWARATASTRLRPSPVPATLSLPAAR